MFANFIVVPILLFLAVLQNSIISRIILFRGSADLILLAVAAWGIREKGRDVFLWALIGGIFISISSAMPLFTPIVPYLFVALIARLIQIRLWQAPILSLIIVVFIGIIFQHFYSIIILQLNGMEISLVESLQKVTLPSLFVNFLFLFPIYFLISDIGKRIYPGDIYE